MPEEPRPFLPGDETHRSADTTLGDPFPGEFRLERRLGGGAFGEVWLARDLSPLARLVALKFLRVSRSPQRNEQALAILRNEARILASLRHPNIVQVYAWKHAPGSPNPCLVLHYVSGGSLDQFVARNGALSWQVAGRYIADVADGLLLVHDKGVIHRDIKPANILIDPELDEALLTDFGIAARLIDTGFTAGTPTFMAPEAFAGEVSPALDVYGLSASLFWLITARYPFDGEDSTAVMENASRGLPAVDPRFVSVPAPLEELLRAGLDPQPERRPSLPVFVDRLRGELNRLLADTLPAIESAVNLRLSVSRRTDAHTYVPVTASERDSTVLLRDLQRVPPEPPSVRLTTGDRIRIEVAADQSGYITLFNVGPTGNLNLLYPLGGAEVPQSLPAGQPLLIEVELTPPAGRERLAALWARHPLPLRLEELRSLVERGNLPASGAYRATRDMARVRQSLSTLPGNDRAAVVLELDHQ